jgi:hypothetical protein
MFCGVLPIPALVSPNVRGGFKVTTRVADAAAADCSDWKGWKSAMEYAALMIIVQVWCA